MTQQEAIKIVRNYIRDNGRSTRHVLLEQYTGQELETIKDAMAIVCNR